MKKLLAVLLFMGIVTCKLSSQTIIKGTITFAQAPVENVSVFLNNTTIGTTTDRKGNFSLNIKKRCLSACHFTLGFQNHCVQIRYGHL